MGVFIMKAARIENNIVVDLWEVPSLTCFEGVTLIEAPEFVSMGASYDGTSFVNPPSPEDALTYAEKRAAAYPSIPDQLDLLYHGGMVAWMAAIKAVKDQFPKE
jgi:hypothetical protein